LRRFCGRKLGQAAKRSAKKMLKMSHQWKAWKAAVTGDGLEARRADEPLREGHVRRAKFAGACGRATSGWGGDNGIAWQARGVRNEEN
jgi:hypothetical protein